MSARCPRVICCGDDDPFANYTADRIFGSAQLFTSIANEYIQPPMGSGGEWSCLSVCRSYTSQTEAETCARRQATLCVIEDKWEDPVSGPILAQLNTEQTCTKSCPDGTLFTWTVPAGMFAAATQAEANALAYARACAFARSNRLCITNIPEGCCLNLPFSFPLILPGGEMPIAWFSIGTLPPGINLVDATGFDRQAYLQGTPTVAGDYTFQVEAVTFDLNIINKTIRLRVIDVSPATLPDATDGVAYSQQLTASGGVGPYKFELVSGSLPPGITLSETGLLSGTTTPGSISYAFSIKITDQGA